MGRSIRLFAILATSFLSIGFTLYGDDKTPIEWNNREQTVILVQPIGKRTWEPVDTLAMTEMLKDDLRERGFDVRDSYRRSSGAKGSAVEKGSAKIVKLIRGSASKNGDRYVLMLQGIDEASGDCEISAQLIAYSVESLLQNAHSLNERFVQIAAGEHLDDTLVVERNPLVVQADGLLDNRGYYSAGKRALLGNLAAFLSAQEKADLFRKHEPWGAFLAAGGNTFAGLGSWIQGDVQTGAFVSGCWAAGALLSTGDRNMSFGAGSLFLGILGGTLYGWAAPFFRQGEDSARLADALSLEEGGGVQPAGPGRRKFYLGLGLGTAYPAYGGTAASTIASASSLNINSLLAMPSLSYHLSLGWAMTQDAYLLAALEGFVTTRDATLASPGSVPDDAAVVLATYLGSLGLRYYPFHTGLSLGLQAGVARMTSRSNFLPTAPEDWGPGFGASIAYEMSPAPTGIAFCVEVLADYVVTRSEQAFVMMILWGLVIK